MGRQMLGKDNATVIGSTEGKRNMDIERCCLLYHGCLNIFCHPLARLYDYLDCLPVTV